jgi:hypothetical protein
VQYTCVTMLHTLHTSTSLSVPATSSSGSSLKQVVHVSPSLSFSMRKPVRGATEVLLLEALLREALHEMMLRGALLLEALLLEALLLVALLLEALLLEAVLLEALLRGAARFEG